MVPGRDLCAQTRIEQGLGGATDTTDQAPPVLAADPCSACDEGRDG